MKPRPEDQEWYFFKAGSDAGLKAGPFSWERLRVLARNGTLEQADVVWDPNSGWKTAAQVPGLYPAVASSAPTGSPMDTPPLDPPPKTGGRSRLYWLSALAVLVIIGAALGAYFGLRGGGDETAAPTTMLATTTSVLGPTTTIPVTGTTIPVTTTLPTATTVTVVTTPGGAPVKYLVKKDSGRELTLRVGDRVRVDLQPWKGDKLKGVWWDVKPEGTSVVQKTGADSVMVDGGVTSTWAEFEMGATGRATIRAIYEYPDGTTASMWVIYLFVK